MRNKYILIAVVLLTLGFGVGRLSAGTPDSPSAPGATNSFTLGDIYNRLDSGAAGVQSTFTEPAAGPGTGTMHTLNEIMAKAPAADNTNGAVPGEVLTGKTYWGLRTDGTWGPRTGSAAAGSNVNGPDGAKTFSIPDGFYSGKTATANDSDLAAGNIVQGVNIFGVVGSAIAATGDATAGDVLTGKTFSNASAAGIAGTMPNNGAVTITPGTSDQAIAAGYHNGLGKVFGDLNLQGGNIKSGVNIFGVGGTLTPGGTATAADLFNGQTAHLAGDWTLDTGTLDLACNTATFNGTANRVADAYDGTGDGSNRWCMTDSGDAAAGNILQGKKAWVDGSEVTGTAAAAGVPKTGQTTSYATGDDGELEKGVAWPNPRFTDNSNGTVTDNLTGLMWLKNADAGNDCAGADTGIETWANALASAAACNTAVYAGYTDWRLPNVREMQSLVDYGRYSPALPSGHPFTGVQSNSYYWTSTALADGTSDAWGVHLSYGYVYYGGKTSSQYVWPVRGGQ